MNLTAFLADNVQSSEQIHWRAADTFAARTHRHLFDNVAKFICALRDIGVAERDKVLLAGGNRVETLESLLGVIGLGATAVPVHPNISQAALDRIIQETEPSCCIADGMSSHVTRAAAAGGCDKLVQLSPAADRTYASAHSYDTLLDRAECAARFADLEPDDPALIMHTSGSTGHPKRIYRTHGQLVSFVEHNHLIFSQYYEQAGNKVTRNPLIAALPVAHLSGLGYCLEGLYSGTPVYLLPDFDPAVVLRLVETLRCRLLILIPSMYELLLYERSRLREVDVSSLKYCLYGGEACPDSLAGRIEQAFGVSPIAAYGLTECLTGIAHSREALVEGRVKRHSCGTQLFGEIMLVDENGNQDVDVGELWVRNRTIPRRHFAGRLDARITEDGWFKTGDILSRDVDGHFFYARRADDMFVCNGNNVYPFQIERMLLEHPGVEAVCLVAVKNQLGHRVPAAMIKYNGQASEADLVRFARQQGPKYAVPAFVEFVDSLPLTRSGKIDRVEAAEHLQRLYELAISARR